MLESSLSSSDISSTSYQCAVSTTSTFHKLAATPRLTPSGLVRNGHSVVLSSAGRERQGFHERLCLKLAVGHECHELLLLVLQSRTLQKKVSVHVVGQMHVLVQLSQVVPNVTSGPQRHELSLQKSSTCCCLNSTSTLSTSSSGTMTSLWLPSLFRGSASSKRWSTASQALYVKPSPHQAQSQPRSALCGKDRLAQDRLVLQLHSRFVLAHAFRVNAIPVWNLTKKPDLLIHRFRYVRNNSRQNRLV